MATLLQFGFIQSKTISSTFPKTTVGFDMTAVNSSALKGEDRTFGGNNLECELIPTQAWGKSGATKHKNKWDTIRQRVLRRVNHTCEFCPIKQSSSLTEVQLQVHEMFEFLPKDEDNAVYKLRRLAVVCEPCHHSIHMGRSRCVGIREAAMQHLKQNRGFSDKELHEHIEFVNTTWETRNKYNLTVDLSLLTNNGCAADPITESMIRKEQYFNNMINGNPKQHFVETSLSAKGNCAECSCSFAKHELKLGRMNEQYQTTPKFMHLKCFESWLNQGPGNILRNNAGRNNENWLSKSITFSDFVLGCEISTVHQTEIAEMLFRVIGEPFEFPRDDSVDEDDSGDGKPIGSCISTVLS